MATASLQFLADLPTYRTEKPYKLLNFAEIAEESTTNCQYVERSKVPLINGRGREHEFSVDTCGWQFIKHTFHSAPSLAQFEDPKLGADVVKDYLSEAIQLVKTTLNADRVFCFDWRIRSNIPAEQSPDVPLEDLENARSYTRTPARAVHCDYTYASGLERVQTHLSDDEAIEVEKGKWRVRIMNLWRPLRPVHNAPLVVCDRRAISLEDYVAVDDVMPDRVEEEVILKESAGGDWYWLEEQQPDESILFVLWDSDTSGLGSYYTPHTSAVLENDSGAGVTAPRESVEVRLVIMHEAKEEGA